MSGLPGRLDSGRGGGSSGGGCGGALAEGGEGCGGARSEEEAPPELWAEELGPRGEDRPLGPPHDGPPPVTRAPSFPTSSSSPPTLANGLHLHRRPAGQGGRRRRQPDAGTPPPAETQTLADSLRSMQSSHVDPAASRPPAGAPHRGNKDNGVRNPHATAADLRTGSTTPEKPRTLSPEETPPPRLTASPQPPTLKPLPLDAPTASANEPAAPVLTAETTDVPSTYRPAPADPNPPKYALRSSGRPRFPCHLRKSSRLRRSTEDGERRGGGRERDGGQEEEEEEAMEEKIWRVKEEEVAAAAAVVKAVVVKEEQPSSVPSALPAAPCPAAVPSSAVTAPKPAPKSVSKSRPKPGPKLCPKPGPKPGPRSRSRPAPKSTQRAGPKSTKDLQRSSSQPHAAPHRPGPHPAFPAPHSRSAFPANAPMHQPAVKKEEPEVNTPTKRRYVGVRRIVVKVARIPVNLSRRQKSYKISNMETHFTGAEKKKFGEKEGSEAPAREPTALLRLKNNGKSVMVMFPPGELPVILKRRRGRPPKQPVPGLLPGEPLNVVNAGGNAGAGNAGDPTPKKPRRRRLTKLPSPYPSYVNDTNDVKTEYGDVLSKLAFLNRQPPATGRCSPPRCWTPSEPESFNTPSENPGISTLLHRLTGFRRRGGGRGGGAGSRGGAAGGAGAGGQAANKSTFSDFFESIGKKRKLSPHSETGLPRKRGKGGAGGGGVGRGGGVVGSEHGGTEKAVRKRRPRKNGALKGEAACGAGQDWANGAGVWGDEGSLEREKGLGGYQACGSPRGGFSSSREGGGRGGGAYGSPGGGRGAGPAGEDSQGLFAGYFRSLLDSDDSSDLLDISSSQADPRNNKAPSSTPGGYEPSSPAPGPCWSPAFSKRSPKGSGSVGVGEGPAQTPHGGSSSSAATRPSPYGYSGLAQTSPTTSTYHPKSTPPSLSLSRSPSSPHPSSYGHYSPGFSSSSPVGGGGGGGGGAVATQRSADCSFSYGGGGGGKNNNNSPLGQGQMNYSSYQVAAAKQRGFGGYPGSAHSSGMGGRGESAGGPTSPGGGGGGGYMAMAKTSPFSSSPCPEGYKQYNSNQWNYRHGYGGWAADSFGSHYHHGYSEYGSNESKDILDISNYTPQKAKRQPFPESLSESSSDSSHLGPVAASCGPGSGGGGGGAYKQKEPAPVGGGDGGQSSLSSLEKLMMDWHESAAGPSYNWSQNVLFQGGAAASTAKQGRGRRKRAAEPQADKEGSAAAAAAAPPHTGGPPSDSPSSPSPTPTPGPKRGAGGRPRGSRGGRGGLSPCQRERPSGAKARAKGASAASGGGVGGSGAAGGPDGPGLFQEGLDYYSGDSSSLSPLATPNAAPPAGYPPDPCEYPSPYSAHPSTPSSEERYPSVYPGESSSSLSPGVSSPPYPPPKPTPQTYHPVPSRTFSPSCSPSPRLTPHCGTALSPPHRPPPPPKDTQYPQYDSPSYSCSSPYWYGQTSHSGSPSPHAAAQQQQQHNTHSNAAAQHTHPNPHASPNPSLPSPHANTHAHVNNPLNHSTQPHPNMSPHSNAPPQQQQHTGTSHLQGSPQAHANPNNSHPHPHHAHHNAHANNPQQQQLHSHANNPGLHSHPSPLGGLYDVEQRPSNPHKRDLTPHHMSTGLRQGGGPLPLPHSPYAKSPLDTSPHHHQEELGGGGYSLPGHPYQGMGHRYPPQVGARGGGGGVLCQLLDPASDDSFSVTSL